VFCFKPGRHARATACRPSAHAEQATARCGPPTSLRPPPQDGHHHPLPRPPRTLEDLSTPHAQASEASGNRVRDICYQPGMSIAEITAICFLEVQLISFQILSFCLRKTLASLFFSPRHFGHLSHTNVKLALTVFSHICIFGYYDRIDLIIFGHLKKKFVP